MFKYIILKYYRLMLGRVYRLNTVPIRTIIDMMITILPTTLLISCMPLVSKTARILSISHVSPYHQSNAPAIIPKYPALISSGWSGMIKANCANRPIMSMIISGLENVTRKAVIPLCTSEPLVFFLLTCIFFIGLLRKE